MREKASNRRKERIQRLTVTFRKEKRACRLTCLSLGLGDDKRGMSGSRDVSLTIFINFMSGSKSLTSFTNCFFHFSGPPGLRLAFDADERNERFCRIQCQSGEESRSRRKSAVFLGKRAVKVKVKSKVIPTSFLKIEGRGTFVGAENRRNRFG